jgi:periplasmic protein TonB
MSNTAALRASSMLVSAGLLSGIVVLALTFSIALPPTIQLVDLNPITAEREPPPPPEPVRAQPTPPPMTTTESTAPTIIPVPPDTPIVDTEPFAAISTAPVLATITDPHWLRRPRDLQRYYPRRALQSGVEGFVVLDCRVAVTGTLGCSVVSETPPNWGFAEAALRIAGDHRMEPAMRGGVAVEGRYRMRVPFRAE